MGTGLAWLTLTNDSHQICAMAGYPDLSLFSPGRTRATAEHTVPGRFHDQALVVPPPPRQVTLAPHGQAVAWVSWADNPDGHHSMAQCQTPTREVVSPPNGGAPIVMSTRIRPAVCWDLAIEPVKPRTYVPDS
jgi:hypothetical protein